VNARRVRGVFRRHMYVSLNSPPILFDMFVWPVLDLLIWGLLTVFIQRQGVDLPVPVGFLLGGVLLWDLLFRSNLGIAIAFLDDAVWTRNAINILVAPLSPGEYVAGASLWALVKLAAGWGVMALLAWVLFSFGIFEIGASLVVFLPAVTLFGVALSMVVAGLVLRFGHGAEILAWGLAAMLLPLSAPYYPLTALPGWAQGLARALPPAHVFESMRQVLAGDPVPWGSLGAALALDVVYLVAAFAFARRMLAVFRRRGFVTRSM
jgi:ABC-type polysaccharide/polyol phosphate export permease